MLKKQNLIEYFYQGIKSKNNLKIGVEHEKFVLNKKNLSHLSYNGLMELKIYYLGL